MAERRQGTSPARRVIQPVHACLARRGLPTTARRDTLRRAMPVDRSPGGGGGPIHLVQVTRHRQLLEQYDEYRAVAHRLREELLETVDQLREIHVGQGARHGEEDGPVAEACWDERTVLGARAWAEDVGVSWRALRVSKPSNPCPWETPR